MGHGFTYIGHFLLHLIGIMLFFDLVPGAVLGDTCITAKAQFALALSRFPIHEIW